MLLRQRLTNLFRGTHIERFTALHEISFSIRSGESLGIIGHNGAGKSTLLNLITGLCLPTAGSVTIAGRIAALLELGSGFHPDLTGMENVHVNASLMGLTRKEVGQLFPAIVDFAGIGDFINEPLRTYSSGMMMRLAFAVAIHVNPDILVVDEVLGVGDQEFFDKCVQRIERLRRAGKTMICVSHSLAIIESLCDRVIWLDQGRIVGDGTAASAIQAYLGASHQTPSPAVPGGIPG
jgi:ABC-type polysaccharide/polyol phosphate transport system ATPase subunit